MCVRLLTKKKYFIIFFFKKKKVFSCSRPEIFPEYKTDIAKLANILQIFVMEKSLSKFFFVFFFEQNCSLSKCFKQNSFTLPFSNFIPKTLNSHLCGGYIRPERICERYFMGQFAE